MSEYKRCSKCDIVKELSEFCFRKYTQKNRNQCRDFIKLITKGYQTMNKDEIKIRFENNRNNTEKLKRLYDIDYRERIRDKIQLYRKNYFQKNKNCTRKLTREKMKILYFD